MTIESDWQFLVEAEKPCPVCKNESMIDASHRLGIPAGRELHEACGYIGLVPVLPGLREKCGGQFAPPHSKECMRCNGAPWVAKPADMLPLLAAMRKAGFFPETNGISWWFTKDNRAVYYQPVAVTGDDGDEIAFYQAARLAVEARHSQKEKT